MLLQRSVIPSLGASGAICGLFAGFCMLYPDTKLQLLILPVFSLEAKYMLLVPICIEAALLVALRNRAGIDFAAHLGGFVFGAAYVWLLKQYANRVGRLER
jgi:membrane associated rhomboid family serine protease